MNIGFEDHGTITVLSPRGALTAEHVDAFRRSLDERLESGAEDIVVDLEQLELADSDGLEALLLLRERIFERGGRLRLVNPTDTMATILRVTRLDGRFEVHETVESAARSLR